MQHVPSLICIISPTQKQPVPRILVGRLMDRTCVRWPISSFFSVHISHHSKFGLMLSADCWRGCGQTGDFLHVQWSCLKLQAYWKLKLEVYLQYHLVMCPLLCIGWRRYGRSGLIKILLKMWNCSSHDLIKYGLHWGRISSPILYIIRQTASKICTVWKVCTFPC